MASADEGYEDQRFEGAIPDYFHCAVCLNVLKQPMQCTRNEHSFCKPCIARYLREFHRCPTCMEPLTLQTLRPSRVIKELISQLTIKCDNVGRGCLKLMKVEMLEDHVKDCEFGPVTCSNDGCELIVTRKDLQQHERNDCNFRKGKCDVCGKDVPHRKRKLHCYVTRTEMGEVREEISSIKEIVTGLSRELTRHMSDVNGQMGNVKNQMSNMERKIDKMENELQKMKQQPQCSIHSLSSPDPYSNQKVDIRNDIIIAGGVGSQSVEMFSWTTRQWTLLPPLMSVHYCSSSIVHQGQMFVCGGWENDSIEVLNLNEEGAKWKNFAVNLPRKTYGHKSVVYEDNIFIFGGRIHLKTVNDIHQLCLVTCSLQLVSLMPEPRMFHGVQLFGDKVVIVGGTTTGNTRDSLDTVSLYDITNNCCQTLAPLPFAVCDMATVAWGDNIIIVGGKDKKDNVLNTMMSYNIKEGKSKMLPPMKHKRRLCAAVVVDNVIVVMGGNNEEEGNLNTVESFNFHSYVWDELPPMNEERWASTAVVCSSF